MKLSQLSLADYNQLDSIPVINQDLSATDFTPVANTYYRHTGATTDTFTQGVIYLYDTAYHKLGESGGGTKLNKYVYANTTCVSGSTNNAIFKRIVNILTEAKGKISILFHIVNNTSPDAQFVGSYCIQKNTDTTKEVVITAINATPNIRIIQYNLQASTASTVGGFNSAYDTSISNKEGVISGLFGSTSTLEPFEITYYNDTEIT